MRLSELLNGNGAGGNIDIRGLASDSREVQPGFLFAALAGVNSDGSDFIDDAIAHGAVAVLAPPGASIGARRVHVLTDENPRRRFALMAARFFGGQPETAVAVTGTNGKSSVVSFVRQIWTQLEYKAASVGTLGVAAPDMKLPPGLTTPDPVTLYGALKKLKGQGVDHVALEASSHGLSQHRLDGLRLKAAALTNVTRDHLDYHGSAENYLDSKLRLFGEVLAPGGIAVLNADDESYQDAKPRCRAQGHRVISVGAKADNIRLMIRQPTSNGQMLTIRHDSKTYEVELPLIGDFQAQNALIAAGLVIANGETPDNVFSALSHLEGVPGRLQLVARHPAGAPIFVDFAHTPDALASVLRALRSHCPGRLCVVFGCGGDRDEGKRPLMGRMAAMLADKVYIADDNPRSEDPARIRADIKGSCPDATEIGNRAEAIRTAIAALEARDLLVVAGKGHERGQVIGGQVCPFSDIDQVRTAVGAVEHDGNG
ncbi:MAG: UDP-N-acetylmuramoyl-L-alanyl-D-glutamate--2,6-diaminopimelate ligase [Sphingomonadales bacterium]